MAAKTSYSSATVASERTSSKGELCKSGWRCRAVNPKRSRRVTDSTGKVIQLVLSQREARRPEVANRL